MELWILALMHNIDPEEAKIWIAYGLTSSFNDIYDITSYNKEQIA